MSYSMNRNKKFSGVEESCEATERILFLPIGQAAVH